MAPPSRPQTIGIVAPGAMGHAVGRTLRAQGFRVATALDGRSARSRALAAQAGLDDLGGLDRLVGACDLLLSILVPAAALDFAEAAAAAMRAGGARPLFVDCNAVSPATMQKIAGAIDAAGGRCLDGGIIGLPPGQGQPTRLYVSGPGCETLESLAGPELLVKRVGPEVGQASAMKMLYAALNKGTWALQTAVLLAGERFGLTEAVCDEIAHSQPEVMKRMRGWLGFLAADAHRWVGEMQEIAETLDSVAVTPKFHEDAEEIFRLLSTTPLAAETRETWDRTRSLEESLRIYAAALPAEPEA